MTDDVAKPAEQELPVPTRPGRRLSPPLLNRRVRVSASSIIENDIREAIISMTWKPGSPLNEKELSQSYGLSRTPVREALLRLKEEGLVEIFPQSGTFVARIPVERIPEIVVIRQGLECMAAELAARRRDAHALHRLRISVEDQQRACLNGDQAAFYEADEAFHALISEAAGFPAIWRVVKTVKSQVDRCRRLTLPVPGRMTLVMDEHLMIVEAIASGDEAGARRAIIAHLSAVLPDVRKLQQDNPDYFI